MAVEAAKAAEAKANAKAAIANVVSQLSPLMLLLLLLLLLLLVPAAVQPAWHFICQLVGEGPEEPKPGSPSPVYIKCISNPWALWYKPLCPTGFLLTAPTLSG